MVLADKTCGCEGNCSTCSKSITSCLTCV
jgi:hypothetical protein